MIVKLSNKIHDKIDIRNEEIKKQIENNPNTKFGLIIGGKPGESEFSDIKKESKKIKKDDKLIKKENNIVKKVEDIIKSVNKYFEEKNKFNNEIQQKIDKTSKNIEEYYKENQNIDFLFTKIHKEEAIKKLDEQIKTFDESIEIINSIKKMLTKYDEC